MVVLMMLILITEIHADLLFTFVTNFKTKIIFYYNGCNAIPQTLWKL
jgi:hypothetical protein